MRSLFYNCFSGISGDMNLGAMIDLGVPQDYLLNELSNLGINNEFDLFFERTQKLGITGMKAHVQLKDTHKQKHNDHRHLADIRRILGSSSLSKNVRRRSMDIFQRIAEAEAKVHGMSLEEVHFHEVGATDSIIDIIGAAICFEYLNIDKVFCSPVQMGGGFVECAHGIFPVPAPATAEILRGIPCRYGAEDSEMTTPTGAAILASLVDEFSADIEMTASKIAYGLGSRDLSIPNVLRVMLGETENGVEEHYLREENLLIECNIDDMIFEDVECLMTRLLDMGARDVYLTSIMMKKSRPAIKLSILVYANEKSRYIDTIFKHSSTFGLRSTLVSKTMLPREEQLIETELGRIGVKLGKLKDGSLRWKPDYQDIRNIADMQEMSLESVRRLVAKKMSEIL